MDARMRRDAGDGFTLIELTDVLGQDPQLYRPLRDRSRRGTCFRLRRVANNLATDGGEDATSVDVDNSSKHHRLRSPPRHFTGVHVTLSSPSSDGWRP